jgi:hypothetical protein
LDGYEVRRVLLIFSAARFAEHLPGGRLMKEPGCLAGAGFPVPSAPRRISSLVHYFVMW